MTKLDSRVADGSEVAEDGSRFAEEQTSDELIGRVAEAEEPELSTRDQGRDHRPP